MTPDQRRRIDALLADRPLVAVLAALNGDGEETRIVGGAVRNLLLDEPVGDIDLATTALPEETARRGAAAGFKAVPTGLEHGTVTLVGHGRSFEATTLRRDVETDGRRAKVAFGRDFALDAGRRDFTMNALYLDRAGAIDDPCGGLPDLAARRVRFIGDAQARIREDYLRILRFFRFHAQYGEGEPDADGYAACIAGRAGLGGLSRERVRAETLKLLVAPGAAAVVEAMLGAGLLLPVLGGVARVARFRAASSSDAAGHLSALILRSRVSGVSKDASGGSGASGSILPDAISKEMAPQDEGSGTPTPTLDAAFRLAALAVSTREDAARLRERLRLSKAEADRIERLALALEALSGRGELPGLADARRLAHRVGADGVAGALVLATARGGPAERDAAQALIAGLGRTPPFELSGKDALALGVPAGPDVGRALEAARAAWITADCPEGREAQVALLAEAVADAPSSFPSSLAKTRDPA